MFVHTTALDKLLRLNKRIRGVAGGTRASKTISILQILVDYAQCTNGEFISVVSETFPHLRRGAIRDFLNIMKEHGYYRDERWSSSISTYTFESGSVIEFFSADMPGKVRGPTRDVLFVNEANNVGYEEFDQLRIRTKKTIWLDWNPTHEFWWYTEIAPRYDHDFVTLTYQDNEGLEPVIIQDIEAHKHNKNWWLVYGLGQLGEATGRIFNDWAFIDDIPQEARLERRGLDFGFSQHPTALIDVYYYNGGFILDQQLYRKGLHNKPLADFINNLERPETTVYADSADPQAIDELRLYGVNAVPAQKGKGSIRQGIDYIQDQRVSVTKRSIDVIHEYRNYMWAVDKDGQLLKPNEPEDAFNHAMDAIRYALETYMRSSHQEVGIVTSTPPGLEEQKSFVVNERGEAEAWHIDLAGAVKRSEEL